jgi:hypothetical protein
MAAAKENDVKFLYKLRLPAGSWIVFDKGYNAYRQFARWTPEKTWFVTRMKDNADFHVTKVLIDKTRKRQAKDVLKEQYITVAVKVNGLVIERLKLRRILFKTDDEKIYVYVTNNFSLPVAQILHQLPLRTRTGA